MEAFMLGSQYSYKIVHNQLWQIWERGDENLLTVLQPGSNWKSMAQTGHHYTFRTARAPYRELWGLGTGSCCPLWAHVSYTLPFFIDGMEACTTINRGRMQNIYVCMLYNYNTLMSQTTQNHVNNILQNGAYIKMSLNVAPFHWYQCP